MDVREPNLVAVPPTLIDDNELPEHSHIVQEDSAGRVQSAYVKNGSRNSQKL